MKKRILVVSILMVAIVVGIVGCTVTNQPTQPSTTQPSTTQPSTTQPSTTQPSIETQPSEPEPREWPCHYPGHGIEDTLVFGADAEFEAVLAPESGLIQIWSHGKLVEEYQLPGEASYGGLSMEGHLFRVGTEVYTLNDGQVELLARGVTLIVDPLYEVSYGDVLLPLFHTVEGELKVYWQGDLQPLSCITGRVFDGGTKRGVDYDQYDHTHIPT